MTIRRSVLIFILHYFQFPAYEKINLLELVETDNKILSKVLSVFAVLCSEVELLTREARVSFYDAILYYGEGGEQQY